MRSPLYSITSDRAIRHSITSVLKSSQFPRSVNPTIKSFVFPSFTSDMVGSTLILSLSVKKKCNVPNNDVK